MNNPQRVPLRLPPTVLPNFVDPEWRPSMQFEFMHIGLFDVSISFGANLDHYIKNSDELVRTLTSAIDVNKRLRNGEFSHFIGPNKIYTVNAGLYTFMTEHPYVDRNKGDDYLTVYSRIIDPTRHGILNIQDCTHYITLDKHEELLRDARLDVSELVIDRVARGIKQGVKSGMKRVEATLEEIQDEREELERRLALLDREEKKAVEKEQEKPKKQQRSLEGFVYLLQAIHDSTLFKIGRAKEPGNRLKTFNVKLPFPVEFDCLIETPDMYALESELHIKFAAKRLDGEWFKLDQTDVEYIRSLGSP